MEAIPALCSSRELLGEYARRMGANYVVLDSFGVREEPAVRVVVKARLYACGRAGPML